LTGCRHLVQGVPRSLHLGVRRLSSETRKRAPVKIRTYSRRKECFPEKGCGGVRRIPKENICQMRAVCFVCFCCAVPAATAFWLPLFRTGSLKAAVAEKWCSEMSQARWEYKHLVELCWFRVKWRAGDAPLASITPLPRGSSHPEAVAPLGKGAAETATPFKKRRSFWRVSLVAKRSP
jgi:hypothetical protein